MLEQFRLFLRCILLVIFCALPGAEMADEETPPQKSLPAFSLPTGTNTTVTTINTTTTTTTTTIEYYYY